MKESIGQERMDEIVDKTMKMVIHEIEISASGQEKKALLHAALGVMLSATGALMLVHAETCGKPIRDIVRSWTTTLAASALEAENDLKDPKVIYLWDRN